MKKPALYLRKSRAEENLSVEEVLQRHKTELMALAEKLNLVIADEDIYYEVVSGSSIAARPQMQRLLDALYADTYDMVLCMDIDRLGRGNMSDQGLILEAFRESGTLIVTPTKTYDLTNDEDEEMTEFKAFFARREYKMIRKRMQRGLMQTIAAGGYVANEPYGYRKVTINKMPSLEIVPEEAVFIHHIYRRYLEGVGAQIISEELNAMGSVPRRNAKWSRNTVRGILRNPTYCGKVAWNRVHHYRPDSRAANGHKVKYMPEEEWLLYDGLHEAIIPEEEWNRAQERRKARYTPPNNTGQVTNPFAGLIKCSNCGANMQQMQSKGMHHLLCNTKGCCAGAKMEYVEELILANLRDIMEALKLAAAESRAISTDHLTANLASLETEKSRLTARISRLYDFLEDGTYDRSTFRERLSAAQESISTIDEQINRIQAEIAKLTAQEPEKAAEAIDNALLLYPTLDAKGKNELLKTIINKMVYTKHKKTKPRDFRIEIHLKPFT